MPVIRKAMKKDPAWTPLIDFIDLLSRYGVFIDF